MLSSLRRVATGAVLLAVFGAPAIAQFGGYFGKNKIQYEKFDWQIYEAPHFDIHYYGDVEYFLDDVVSIAESAYLKISKELDHELRIRVPLIIYKTHEEFRQTNITLAELPEGVAAFAEPIKNRMVLPIDMPLDELYGLVAHELTHIFQYSILYEGSFGRAIRANPPLWFMEGMASYLGEDETNFDRMAIRDAVVNNFLPPIQALDVLSFLTYRYGHAVFDFIVQEHGIEGFRNFVYEYRKVLLGNNIGKAIKESFGYDINEFNRRFNRYLRKKYFPVLLEKKSPDEYGTAIGLRKGGREIPTFSPTISPSGELVAALSFPGMEIDLVVISAEDGSKVKNLTKGWTNKYESVVTEAFTGKRDVSWSPAGDEVVVFAKKSNRRQLLIHDALTGKRQQFINLGNIYEAAAPAYSPDGRRIAFEGNQRGVVDIFEYDLDTGEIRNLTQDEFFDTNPWYADDGKSLLYNRRIGAHWKIFSVDLSDPSRKTQITFGPYTDVQPSYSNDGTQIFFSSDRDPYGVFNIYGLDLETGEVRKYTDVVGGCFAPVEMAERDGEPFLVFSAYFAGSFRLYRMPLREPEEEVPAAEILDQPVEAEPYEPPLKLTVDDAKKTKYKIRWDMDIPSLAVGVTDDGTFLTNIGISFTDLLGDHRASISAFSVSSFGNILATYMNVKNRMNWGARVYDLRDYFLSIQDGGIQQDLTRRSTGGEFFIEYPLNRFYRVGAGAGYLDQSQSFVTGIGNQGQPEFTQAKDSYVMLRASLTGDTARYQNFGVFQGKLFNFEAMYGLNLGGDTGANLEQYNFTFRTYKQVTRRSVLAWRLAGFFSTGQQNIYYGFGGLNQLRGYAFREFFGSRVGWSNLEFRFPLADSLNFPILGLGPIRGLFFLDVGTAKFQGDAFYDPVLRGIRDPELYPFEFWDSENSRLQDLRASYGVGFWVPILGLQWNWVWSKKVPFTQYWPSPTAEDPFRLIKVEADTDQVVSQFYIVYDW
jgi:hypothetical protein